MHPGVATVLLNSMGTVTGAATLSTWAGRCPSSASSAVTGMPSLRASSDEQTSGDALVDDDLANANAGIGVDGQGGGVAVKKSVWKLENSTPLEAQGMDF